MKLLSFEKSPVKNKKYRAKVLVKKDVIKNVDFGDSRYEHYKDSTGLGLWSHKDHNDSNRRRLFRARHRLNAKKKYSPAWFSWNYLW